MLAAVGGVLWQVDDRTAADHHPGPLRAAGGCAPGLLAPSPDGAFVALYTRGHKLVVLAAGGLPVCQHDGWLSWSWCVVHNQPFDKSLR